MGFLHHTIDSLHNYSLIRLSHGSHRLWHIFFTGRAAGEGLQRELVRGVCGTKCIGNKGLGSGEIREKAKGSLWAYKKRQRCIFSERTLAEVQAYKNRMANKFAMRFLYAWTFPLSVEKYIEHPKPSLVSVTLPVKKSNHGHTHQHPQSP